jgi:hypothetical protein
MPANNFLCTPRCKGRLCAGNYTQPIAPIPETCNKPLLLKRGLIVEMPVSSYSPLTRIKYGGPGRNRTTDTRIFSPLLDSSSKHEIFLTNFLTKINPTIKPQMAALCKSLIFLVGARGFEPPTPAPHTSDIRLLFIAFRLQH